MSKCQTCGTDIITFEHAEKMGYTNAGPWLRLIVFKVRNETDNSAYQFNFCDPQCLLKFAKVLAGEAEPIQQNEVVTTIRDIKPVPK